VSGLNASDCVRVVSVARLSAVCRHVQGDTHIRTWNPLPNASENCLGPTGVGRERPASDAEVRISTEPA